MIMFKEPDGGFYSIAWADEGWMILGPKERIIMCNTIRKADIEFAVKNGHLKGASTLAILISQELVNMKKQAARANNIREKIKNVAEFLERDSHKKD